MLGDFNEGFMASRYYWQREQYLTQWQEAIQRPCDGHTKSALFTSMVLAF